MTSDVVDNAESSKNMIALIERRENWMTATGIPFLMPALIDHACRSIQPRMGIQ
jgi:hypothetical protein